MLVLFYLLFYSGSGAYCCSCTVGGSSIDCSTDDNVAPVALIGICPNNTLVTSISIGFSVFCYSAIQSSFPHIESIYVGGGEGSRCDCYSEIFSSRGYFCSDRTSTMITSTITNNYVTTTEYIPPVTAHTQNSDNYGNESIIYIVVIIGLVAIFGAIILIAYKFFYLKIRAELQTYRDHLVENACIDGSLEHDDVDLENEVDALGSDYPNAVGQVGTVGIRPPAVADIGGELGAVGAGSRTVAIGPSSKGTEDIRPPAVASDGAEGCGSRDLGTGGGELRINLHESDTKTDASVSSNLSGKPFKTPANDGILNSAYSETPESSIQLMCENQQSHITGRALFENTKDEIERDYEAINEEL